MAYDSNMLYSLMTSINFIYSIFFINKKLTPPYNIFEDEILKLEKFIQPNFSP